MLRRHLPAPGVMPSCTPVSARRKHGVLALSLPEHPACRFRRRRRALVHASTAPGSPASCPPARQYRHGARHGAPHHACPCARWAGGCVVRWAACAPVPEFPLCCPVHSILTQGSCHVAEHFCLQWPCAARRLRSQSRTLWPLLAGALCVSAACLGHVWLLRPRRTCQHPPVQLNSMLLLAMTAC